MLSFYGYQIQASRRNSSVKFMSKLMAQHSCVALWVFFSDDNIYVNFLHLDNKYVDSRTLGCLSVLWWIKLYSEQTAWKTDLVLATCEELLTCQRNILLYREGGRWVFPVRVVLQWNIDTYWKTRNWGKGLHTFMTAATVSHYSVT